MTTIKEREGKINSGHWYEGDLAEKIEDVQAAWDDASAGRGSWEYPIDVADLTKILTELQERRGQDG